MKLNLTERRGWACRSLVLLTVALSFALVAVRWRRAHERRRWAEKQERLLQAGARGLAWKEAVRKPNRMANCLVLQVELERALRAETDPARERSLRQALSLVTELKKVAGALETEEWNRKVGRVNELIERWNTARAAAG